MKDPILSHADIAERPGGLEYLDLQSLREWAAEHDIQTLLEALPDAPSARRLQRAMIPAFIQEHIRRTVGDDMAEEIVKAQSDRFQSFPEKAREAAPLWVYSMDTAEAVDAQIQGAIEGGELTLYDAAGMPVERPPRPPEARLLAPDEQMPEAAIPTPSPAPAPPLGVVKTRIIGAFEPPGRYTPETWEKALGDAKRIEWLGRARVFAGGSRTSALWNPAQLAMCICDQYKATPQQRRAYARIIEKQFPEYLPEWQEYDDSFR